MTLHVFCELVANSSVVVFKELANAYVELNDPDEQELRFRTQV